jgi:hypothetical protein
VARKIETNPDRNQAASGAVVQFNFTTLASIDFSSKDCEAMAASRFLAVTLAAENAQMRSRS